MSQIRRPPPVFSASLFPQRWDRLPPQARLRPRPPSSAAPRPPSPVAPRPSPLLLWSDMELTPRQLLQDLTPALWSDLELDARVFAGHHSPSFYFHTGVLVMDLRRYCQHMQWWMETQEGEAHIPRSMKCWRGICFPTMPVSMSINLRLLMDC
jgi:hypothetical protein